MDLIKKIYQNISGRVRYGFNKNFFTMYNQILQSKNWNLEKLIEYQWIHLKSLLNYAYKFSPYYQKKFAEYGISPSAIKDFSDFSRKVPILTKDDVKKYLQEMITLPPRKLLYVTTGGSTGIPLGFYLEKGVTYQKTLAFEWRHFNEGGYFWGDKCVVLRGLVIKKGVFKYDYRRNLLYLSVFDMSDDNLKIYVNILRKFKPHYIRAYPSAIEILSKFIIENYSDLWKELNIKAIFTTSETLYDYQRSIIKKAFNASIFDKYGNSEQCTIIGECREGKYHEDMEYSYTEYIPVNNSNLYKIISTSFVNRATPFIRYDTGDMVELDNKLEKKKCKCGRSHRIIKKIIGREQDFLIGKNNEKISVAAINTHTNVFDNVEKFRYVQYKPGEAIIEIKRGKNYTIGFDDERILKEVTYRTKNKIKFIIKYVDEFPLTQRGKFSFIVNYYIKR